MCQQRPNCLHTGFSEDGVQIHRPLFFWNLRIDRFEDIQNGLRAIFLKPFLQLFGIKADV